MRLIKISFAIILFSWVLSSCGTGNDKQSEQDTVGEQMQMTGQNDMAATGQDAETEPEPEINPDADVIITTVYGTIQLMLYDQTPRHRDNFLKLASEGFYDGTLFHRVMKDFMVQGGDPDSRGAASHIQLGNGGPGYTIPAEFRPSLLHKRGALAAARLGDFANPEKESSGSQFYIVQGRPYSNDELSGIEAQSGIPMTLDVRKMYRTLGGTPFLDHAYTVFGEVLEGMEVVDKITMLETDENDRPKLDVPMEVKVVNQ